MAGKFKKRISSRSQERLNRAIRAFDLSAAGLLLTATVCGIISYFRGADLAAHASSGFAYWFLVVIGYIPMLPVNCVRSICGMPIPAAGAHAELYLQSTVDLIWLIGLWLTFRTIGKRNGKSQLLHIATRVAQIFICWGVFQLCCVGITIGFNRGGKQVVAKSCANAKTPR